MGKFRNAYVLIGKPQGRRQVGRPQHTWEDNFKTDLRKISFEIGDWIQLAESDVPWRSVVNTMTKLRFL
jgi:hypothetical protein